MAKNEVVIKFLGDSSGFNKVVGDIEGKTGGLGSKFSKMGSAAAAGFAAAGVAAVAFGKSAIDAAAESQKVAAQTDAVIRSTGGAAGIGAKAIGDLAHQLQNISGVSDEAIQTGQNMLLTFTNVQNRVGKGNDIFSQATQTMLDMSVALGTDAKQSALQLGKALNDPIKGIGALSRVGVTFTAQQKEQIAAMVKAGDVAGAQKVILAELNKEFGGSAKAAGDARTPMEKLSMQFGDIQEKVGTALLPVMEKLSVKLGDLIKWFENLSPGMQNAIEIGVGVVAAIAAIGAVIAVVTPIVGALTAAVGLLLSPITLVGIAIALLAIIVVKNWDTIKEAFMTGVRFVVDKFLGFVETIITGAATAFGWIPGIGPKLRQAAKDFEALRDDVNRSLEGIHGEKVIYLKLKGGDSRITVDDANPTKTLQDPRISTGNARPTVKGKRARGGSTDPWSTYLVGEEGPELLTMGDRGGFVHANGGANTYVTLNFQGQALHTVRDIEDAVRRALEGVLGRGAQIGDGRGNYLQMA